VRANPQRVVFAEGEEEKSIRAALAFRNAGYGTPVLIGREERIRETVQHMGLPGIDSLEIVNARVSDKRDHYADVLYKRMQRKGALYRDVQRLVNQERNIWGALMVAEGDADAMVTGLTRNYWQAFDEIKRVIDPAPGERLVGFNIMLARGRTVFIADTTMHELPTPEQLADIAVQTAAKARQMGHEPRVALLSYSNFGNPANRPSERVREAVAILDGRQVDFEYDGEMSADVALDPALLKHYPFCRLSGPANVLVMPGLHSANISWKLMQKLGGGTVIGPILMGMSKPIQITSMDATVNDIVNMAMLACYDSIRA
ncbi:MAG: NADP-dependent malic enzyme, partial [Rhodospirillaceae bacterium]|nr:NADP-dependent malic enzyme [Rhodospirillales bacterium]